ncbi:MAG: hypothetical protein DWI58_16695 [Chloroflexi bacterium]|nr:MAG: hypothetical protein DWI58_16695 [Chloroflexota bacterium]
MIERFWTHPPRGSMRFALAAGAVAIATPVVALLHALLPKSSLAVAYLPAVIAVAVLAGRAPALLSAALALPYAPTAPRNLTPVSNR